MTSRREHLSAFLIGLPFQNRHDEDKTLERVQKRTAAMYVIAPKTSSERIASSWDIAVT
jgi:hypothetical protein